MVRVVYSSSHSIYERGNVDEFPILTAACTSVHVLVLSIQGLSNCSPPPCSGKRTSVLAVYVQSPMMRLICFTSQ